LIIAYEEIMSDKAMAEVHGLLTETATMLEIHMWGCFMNDARLANHAAKQLLMQMKTTPGGVPSHYERVSSLHLSSAQIGKDTQQLLAELLKMKGCRLRMLDVSNTKLDGAALVSMLDTNASVTSLDVRMVPQMADSYEAIGDMLLKPDSASSIAYMRCDAFEVLEGEAIISLREQSLSAGSMRLLTGLLKNNRDVQELDLAATSLQKSWVAALLDMLASNPTVTKIELPYNPAIDDAAQKELIAAVEKRSLRVALGF